MTLVLIWTSVFHGLLRTVGFADYQITVPVTFEFSKLRICPGVSDQNEKPGKSRGRALALGRLFSGRVILPSLNFLGLNSFQTSLRTWSLCLPGRLILCLRPP
jgi:hypothetical protein